MNAADFLRTASRPAVRAAIAIGLALYFLYFSTGFEPARTALSRPAVDSSIIYSRARQIAAAGDYPARLGNLNLVFPYPPSAVLIFALIARGGARLFQAIWMLLMAVSLVISMRAAAAGERGAIRSAWLAIGVLALLVSGPAVSWDLRSGNSNLIYLGLVMAAFALMAARPMLAGTLLGISASLKLYSALLIAWLLVSGPRRAFYAAGAVIVTLWLAVPLLLFGAHGTLGLYQGWREQLRIIGGPWVYAAIVKSHQGAPLMMLRRALIVLTGAAPGAAIVTIMLLVLWTIWLAALVWYAAAALRAARVRIPSQAALADWSVLMMAPLPFSPWLETYHAVPLLPAAILCLIAALDTEHGRRERGIAAAAFAVLLALRAAPVPLPVRGLQLLAQFLIAAAAFAAIRSAFSRGLTGASALRSDLKPQRLVK